MINNGIFSDFSKFVDYPDYNSRIYPSYGADVKYEDGEEQKYRPQDQERLNENNGQGYGRSDNEYEDRGY